MPSLRGLRRARTKLCGALDAVANFMKARSQDAQPIIDKVRKQTEQLELSLIEESPSCAGAFPKLRKDTDPYKEAGLQVQMQYTIHNMFNVSRPLASSACCVALIMICCPL